MPLPYSYERLCKRKITDLNFFVSKLKKINPKLKFIEIKKNKIVFISDKSLIPFNYEVKIKIEKDKTFSYEVSLVNLSLIVLTIVFLLLFVIKNIISLVLTGLIIAVLFYLINILHINTVLEYWFEQAIENEVVICPSCGKEVEKDTQVCPFCGMVINADKTNNFEIKYTLK